MNKQLYRSRKNRMIAGVAGGLAEYFDIDPVIARVAFVITIFGGGLGIIAYIILWIVVPEKAMEYETAAAGSPPLTEYETISPEIEARKSKRRMAAGVILIIVGSLWLADNLIPQFHFGHFWPLVLVVIGVLILMKYKSKD